MEIYQVKSGDSLSAIARDVLGDMSRWPDIARLNNLVSPYTIIPGMQLVMPDTEVLGPVVVKAERRPFPTRPTPAPRETPAPTLATLTTEQWTYLGIGAVLLFVLLGRR